MYGITKSHCHLWLLLQFCLSLLCFKSNVPNVLLQAALSQGDLHTQSLPKSIPPAVPASLSPPRKSPCFPKNDIKTKELGYARPPCCQSSAPPQPTSHSEYTRGAVWNFYIFTHLRHNHHLFKKRNTKVIEGNHSSFDTDWKVPQRLFPGAGPDSSRFPVMLPFDVWLLVSIQK